MLQHWQDVADPQGVVLEAFDGCDNLSLHDFWVGVSDGRWRGGGLVAPAQQELWVTELRATE